MEMLIKNTLWLILQLSIVKSKEWSRFTNKNVIVADVEKSILTARVVSCTCSYWQHVDTLVCKKLYYAQTHVVTHTYTCILSFPPVSLSNILFFLIYRSAHSLSCVQNNARKPRLLILRKLIITFLID